ncbi:hypothetical protein [Phytohabitans houttuyneae]|uniref:Uncharacterized protein n=1 Tax=Phytohabitans houttuyneae TaxID=1076126 RepID=A0A6V8K246_9ACTN|nr:hypothetical protein [Phytohabitans houttuyneae]GFJ76016.1 hypothetical protein Phou_001960 [Phytohabitans houttuyneae]
MYAAPSSSVPGTVARRACGHATSAAAGGGSGVRAPTGEWASRAAAAATAATSAIPPRTLPFTATTPP